MHSLNTDTKPGCSSCQTPARGDEAAPKHFLTAFQPLTRSGFASFPPQKESLCFGQRLLLAQALDSRLVVVNKQGELSFVFCISGFPVLSLSGKRVRSHVGRVAVRQHLPKHLQHPTHPPTEERCCCSCMLEVFLVHTVGQGVTHLKFFSANDAGPWGTRAATHSHAGLCHQDAAPPQLHWTPSATEQTQAQPLAPHLRSLARSAEELQQVHNPFPHQCKAQSLMPLSK